MPEFRVVWQIRLEKIVKAKNEKEAKEIIENIDCQNDGEYISGSFEFTGVYKD